MDALALANWDAFLLAQRYILLEQKAINLTQAGGVVRCIGPAVFSNFSIDKSLTVDCTGMTGRLAPTVVGIGVEGDGISVVIKGIEILTRIYARSAIEFTQGASLTLEDIEISGGTSVGVKVTAPNASLKNVSIANSNASWAPPGHVVAINAASGLTKVSIEESYVSS